MSYVAAHGGLLNLSLFHQLFLSSSLSLLLFSFVFLLLFIYTFSSTILGLFASSDFFTTYGLPPL